MGIIISYEGSLTDPSTLDEAISEIRGFSARAGWRCDDFSEHYSGVLLWTNLQQDGGPGAEERDPEPWPELPPGQFGLRARVSKLRPPTLLEETVRGALVRPPGTESLRLAFNSSGRLTAYIEVPAELVINALPGTSHYIFMPHWVKTSGAPASHAGICLLLRMLKQRLMTDIKVSDETGFWDTWDVRRLSRKHGEMAAFLNVLRESKNIDGLLRELGLELPNDQGIKQLDPSLKGPVRRKKKDTLN
jgi:hypothetical protein